MDQVKIPTNHGDLTVGEIFDHLNYTSYCVQREAGVTTDILKKWYSKADLFEEKYQLENKGKSQQQNGELGWQTGPYGFPHGYFD